MKLLFKVPKLVKTQYWNDISFSQVSFHSDDWNFIRNEKITTELLEKIKALPYPNQRLVDEPFQIDWYWSCMKMEIYEETGWNDSRTEMILCSEQQTEFEVIDDRTVKITFVWEWEFAWFLECMKNYLENRKDNNLFPYNPVNGK